MCERTKGVLHSVLSHTEEMIVTGGQLGNWLPQSLIGQIF